MISPRDTDEAGPRTTIAVVGAGRLARALVDRLSPHLDVIVVRRDAGRPPVGHAQEVTFHELDALRRCAVALLALPPAALSEVVALVAPHLGDATIVVNMATEADTSVLQRDHPQVVLAAAKLVGQAGAISQGSPALVLVDHADEPAFHRLQEVLGPLGTVVRGSERLVLSVNSAVAEEIVAANRSIRERLGDLGLPPAGIDIAVSTMAVGMLQALCRGEAGPFLRKFVDGAPA